ncbi:MAG TPA: hypothetical protein VNK04_13560 [Gemmataceae bacterium]|nr:hypothetical protein [Gemmataceae bacterium]
METPIRQEPSAGSPSEQYEFTSGQNAVIRPLVRDMVWVAVPLQLMGVLYGIASVLAVLQAFRDPQHFWRAALIGLAMLFYLALGVWTGRAARAFKRIVATQGQDITHLMKALDNLRKLYALVSLFVKVYVVFVVVVVVAALLAALITAFRA